MIELLLLFISVILILTCGLFVMAEFALITTNRSKVERAAEKGDRQAQGILHALTTLSTQLSSAQVGITVTNLAIGFLAEPAIAHFLESPLKSIGVPEEFVSEVSIVIGIALATCVTMVFGELIPKNIAIAKPMQSSRLILRPLLFFTRIMRLPIRILNDSANLILKQFHVEPQEELASARSADELVSLVRRSAVKGTLAKETATMLERSLTFGDRIALDIMTPRVRVKSLPEDATVDEVLQLAKTTGLSRFPVYKDSIDNVVGVVHIKHVFSTALKKRDTVQVNQIMQPPVLVPSTIELEPLLAALKKSGLQMAIIVDEFGGMDGVATIEDVLEELVGEVHDEHDHTRPDIQKIKGAWLLSGLLRPDEIAEQIEVILPEEEDVETLGGLIIQRLERIPKVKDEVKVAAIDSDGTPLTARLIVQKMEGNRIDRVRLTILPPEHDVNDEEPQS
jgi:CBS domain containing-hemolysin-like protein